MKQVVAVCLLLIIAAQASYVRTLVGLKQDVAAAEAMLMEISDPRSPTYAHYLTPEQVGDLIGASPQDIQSVITFLESRGARAINVLPTKDWIQAELPAPLAAQMQKSIPEQIRTKVDFIQVLNNAKKLETNEEFNHLAVALPESAPLVFLHRTVLGDSVDLWIVPNSRASEIQEIQVRLESFDKRFNIPALERSLAPEGASMQCMPCEQLTMKPRIPSEPNFCSKFVENHLVCFARDLQFEIPEDLPENFLWKLGSRIRTSGHWSELGWFSGLSFAGAQHAIPFELAADVWDPNSQKAQYQQSTTLVGTSGAASQIVWGTGSYGYSTNDLSKFYTKYDIPTSTSYVSGAGDAGNPTGDNYVEAELDIQYVTAFGPQITSECVNTDNSTNAEGSTGFGSAFLEFTTYINTLSNPPLVISLSLGSLSWDSCNILCSQAAALGASTYDYCLNYVQSQFQVCMYSSADQVNRINTELMKMGMIGVSVFGAAGDGGNHFSFGAFKPFGPDANLAQTLNEISCNYTLPTFPAASPWVTAVGATQMKTDASGYYPVGCSTQTGGGITGGCGFSWMFAMPSYQQTVVESYLNAFSGTNFGNFNASGRAYPDISGIGSSIPIVFNGITTMVDGTSCSTPTVAGMFSLINDNRLNNGLAPLGFINTRLYQAAATQASSMFVDVTQGSSECGIGICCDTGFDAAAGWDAFTGWGNPLFPGLLAAFST